MALSFGYLLPTRERIMEGLPETKLLLDLADRAEDIGMDSVWVGDSIVARPRHEPLTLLAAVAGRTKKVQLGTAVLLPALRNPVLLAHQVATLDQISEGRVILGVGIATDAPTIRAEFEAVGVPFEKRVGRMMEGLRLCRALWTGKPVTWGGRWTLNEQVLGPTPYREGGPPIWVGSRVRAGIVRAGKHFDGWFPAGANPQLYREQLNEVREVASAAGRAPTDVAAAVYVTLRIDDDAKAADRYIDNYLSTYYGVPAAGIRKHQANFAGPESGAMQWLQSYIDAGVNHLVIRLAGDHERQMGSVVRIREALLAANPSA
jgi:alkanesulfonate monooxygenase SsuD/methylene tetrahydromethanopterin reductase-like flavin-dependent oxidoreductase (luciferase family)